MAAADDVDDVSQGGAGGRGDDADAVGKGGQRGAGAVEEAFAAEAVAELLEGELEGAGAARTEGFGDELELAAGFVDGDATADFNREAVAELEVEQLGLAPEHDDGELGVPVFEREVEVAGAGGAAVGDLALDVEDAGVGGFEVPAELGDELADGVEDGLAGDGCGGNRFRRKKLEGELACVGGWLRGGASRPDGASLQPAGGRSAKAQEARDGAVVGHGPRLEFIVLALQLGLSAVASGLTRT